MTVISFLKDSSREREGAGEGEREAEGEAEGERVGIRRAFVHPS